MKKKQALFIGLLTFFTLAWIHFHDLSIFSRHLLPFDDMTFVQPLAELDAGSYFTDWMFAPNHFAFPLRDLTFAFDFRMQDWLGIQTFWLTNFVLYCLIFVFIGRIALLYFSSRNNPKHATWVVGVLSLLALHPIHVEIIQWASNRKYLTVGVVLAWGTYRVMKQKWSGQVPGTRDWIVYFTFAILAWLCWPSCSLWIFWVWFVFHEPRSFRPVGPLIAGGLLTLGALAFVVHINAEYAPKTNEPFSLHPLLFFFQGIGRGTWDWFLPFWIVPYDRLGSVLNWLGLGFFVALAFWIYRRYRNANSPAKQHALYLVALSLAIFIPQSRVYVGAVEFVWGDRYLFLPVLFLVLGILLLCREPETHFENSKKKKLKTGTLPSHSGAWTFAFAILFLFEVGMGMQLAPHWSSDVALFSDCASREHSPKCLSVLFPKLYRDSGCTNTEPYFQIARTIARQSDSIADFDFQSMAALFEGICAAETPGDPEIKSQTLNLLKRVYAVPAGLSVGEILVAMKKKEIDRAWQIAKVAYLDQPAKAAGTSQEFVNFLRGQLDGLCTLRELVQKDSSCRASIEAFDRAFQTVPDDPTYRAFGKDRTLNGIR